MSHHKRSLPGQTILEVLLAVAISAIVFISLLTLGNLSTKNATRSRNLNLATSYSSQAGDWLRQSRNNFGWDAIASKFIEDADGNESVSYCLITLPATQDDFLAIYPGVCDATQIIPNTIYTRLLTINLSMVGENIVKASIKTSWPDNTDASSVVEVTIGKTQ